LLHGSVKAFKGIKYNQKTGNNQSKIVPVYRPAAEKQLAGINK